MRKSKIKFTPERRQAFSDLINILRKLGVTKYMHLPTVSNPWHLFDYTEVEREYARYRDRKGIKKK